ncbi:hypothetical protein H9Y04_03735 [Streptomyces sp. TRM66268-LWL]|uniref:DUF3168 domain-containing protein n=1 Tax=Streptomyces polyasparticus TaxID=2767826 RepID=A0ABR7S8C5_9ACTN|nr:hypothetical protein [Streptomyces polyasparticus]MBC9711678.1 hypothetical protein [Streptomyces polyasparticus]
MSSPALSFAARLYDSIRPAYPVPRSGRPAADAPVLRADGVLAAMWNIRDDRTPRVAALSGIVGSEGYGMESAWPYGPVTPWFTDPERGMTEHTVTVPTDRLTDLVRSRSSYLTADAAEQARLDQEITELAATDPALADRDTIDMPYRTWVYRMRRV